MFILYFICKDFAELQGKETGEKWKYFSPPVIEPSTFGFFKSKALRCYRFTTIAMFIHNTPHVMTADKTVQVTAEAQYIHDMYKPKYTSIYLSI